MAEESGGLLQFPRTPRPAVEVVLWEQRRPPQEGAVRSLLESDGYYVIRWVSEPDQTYIPHAHIYPELLWLLEGSITIALPAARKLIELMPGDRIVVPPGMLHGAKAGPDGAVYLMATR